MNPPGNSNGPGPAAAKPQETLELHTRLLKCALEVEEARAYWRHVEPEHTPSAEVAFADYWFGARSLPRVVLLLSNLRARFDAFPDSLRVLACWPAMAADTRKLICHWHLQLSDPLYRQFSGDFLPHRRAEGRESVTRDVVIRWVSEHGLERWTMATRIQFASKLLSSALGAGLVGSNRDPRPLSLPRVPDEALEYLLYCLRGVEFAGTLQDNPYLRSLGLERAELENRLYALPSLRYSRQADLVDYGFRYPSLRDWAQHTLAEQAGHHAVESASL